MQLGARADVRREGTDAVEELLRRAAPVEHAVVRPDLLGVGHALGRLRHERRLRQHLVEQLDAELGRPPRDRRVVVLLPDRERTLRRDRPRVELGHELDDRRAGLRVTGHQRPLDRRGAPPARKQRRVDVQPERAVEHRLGDERAVRGEHDRRLLGVEVLQALGLAHLDAQPLGRFLRGRRPKTPPAALWPVRPSQQVRDVVPRRQPFEHVGAERRRRGDGQPH